MNIKLAIVSGIALVAASASFAEEIEFRDSQDVVSPRTRAEVIAELEAARANGTLYITESQYPVSVQSTGPMKTREEVVAELNRFRAQNPYFNSEVNYPDVSGTMPQTQRYAGMDTPSPQR